MFQTYKDSEVLRYAADLDFENFLQFDLEFREMLNYPPFSRLIAIIFRGEDEGQVVDYANNFAAALEP